MRINTSYQSAQKSDECTQTGILSQEVRNPRMWSGFTLIELLVCIAVIALIAAILFPTFMQARERGRKTVCLSNEKQIVQALQLYTQDHDETLPYWDAAYLTYPTLPEKISTLWKTSVQPYLKSGNPAGYVSKGKVYPETGVWRCPSIDAWKDGLGFSGTPHPPVPPTRPATASYGMSMYIAYDYFGPAPARGRTRYRPGLPLSMLRTPSNTVIVGEGGYTGRIDTPIQRRWLYFENLYKDPNVQNWERRDAHTGGSNYVFCDGHARWINAETIYPGDRNAAIQSAISYFAATELDYKALGGK